MNDNAVKGMTPDALKAVENYAERHATTMKHNVIDTGHLLLGLMSTDSKIAFQSPVARRLQADLKVTLYQVHQAVESIDHTTTRFSGRRRQTSAVKDVLKQAAQLAKEDPSSPKGTITRFHIAQALGQSDDPMFHQVLGELGLSRGQFAKAMGGKYSSSVVG